MPLFESGYKAAAVTELERSVRELEARNKTAQTKANWELQASTTGGNVNFAQLLELVSLEQANAFKERIESARREFADFERTESREIVDDYENPRERAERYQSMDKYTAEITAERAKTSELRSEQQNVASRDKQPIERS